jgi:surface antigen
MSVRRVVKALIAPVVTAAALAAPILAGGTPAQAASCEPDPLNGVCVAPVSYKVSASKVTVQRTPKTGNTLRSIANGTTVGVICQVSNGGAVTGYPSKTWTAIAGGGWIYDNYLSTPAQGTGGYSPGIRHCGTAAATETALNLSAYPWPTVDTWVVDGHGYYEGECVSFAAWAVRSDGRAHTKLPDFLANANQWTGAYTDTTPHVGDVAQWDAGVNGAGSVGHVAYVTAVNSNGTVSIAEYNWGTFHRLNSRTIATTNPSRYLHF